MKISFTPIIYPDQTTPKGALCKHMGCQACWHFYCYAQLQKETVGAGPESQILLEGDLWMDTHYVGLARRTALIYGLESPDEFAKHWKCVIEEARNCGLPQPDQRYMRLAPGIVLQ